MLDRKGIIYKGRKEGMNWAKEEIARLQINRTKRQPCRRFSRADVFIGVSTANIVSQDMVKLMNPTSSFCHGNPAVKSTLQQLKKPVLKL